MPLWFYTIPPVLLALIMVVGVGYFFYFEDIKLHAIMIALIAGFLGIVLFMIVINDRPFVGQDSVSPDSYQLILDTLMAGDR